MSRKRFPTVLILIGFALGLASPWTLPAKEKPKAASVAPESLVWPPPPAPAKIKWVAEYRNEFDLGAKKRRSFVDRLAGKSEDSMWVTRPLSVAIDDEGVLYVGDMEQGVLLMDPNGHRMISFTKVSGHSLATPAGVAVDSKLVFVADANSSSVSVFDKTGKYLYGIGEKDGVKRPVGIAVDESRDIVVLVNAGNHEVLLLSRQLKLKKKVGKRGGGDAQFNFPTHACMVDGVGFAVVDSMNFRVELFNYDGKFIRAFGKAGDASGLFSRPKGIAADPDGNLYVSDANFCNFQVFRQDGQLLTFVGDGGKGKGKFLVPSGMGSSKSGLIAVADQLNGRIQVFQYLSKGGEDSGVKAQASPK